MGPNDRLLTSTLIMPRVPIFDELWSQTNVCVWDVAAAHLLHEDALRRIPEEAAGQAFLVTGKGPAWRFRDIRNAVQVSLLQIRPFNSPRTDSSVYVVLLDSFSHIHGRAATPHIHSCASRRALLISPILHAAPVLLLSQLKT